MSLDHAVTTARRRQLTGAYWHQGATKYPVTTCADPARGPGRYHRTGEPGVWYASNREQGAWAELFRKADGYHGTRLYRDVATPGIYVDRVVHVAAGDPPLKT